MAVTVAIDKHVGANFINRLEQYAKVELYDNPAGVWERVKRIDDISGIIKDGEEYVALLESNEPG